MLPGFTASAALTAARTVYYGTRGNEASRSVISPQEEVQVSRVDGDDGAAPPCVCPCCVTVSGRLICCN
jgi:hypothetical protein